MLIHKSHETKIETRREMGTEERKKKIIHKSPETRVQVKRETGKEEKKRKIGEKMTENQEMKGRETEKRRSTEPGKVPGDIEVTTTDALIRTMNFPITMTTTNTTITSPASDTPGMIWR